MPRPLVVLLAGAFLGLTPAAGRADSIRCQGGIVSEGDSKLDLLGKCGQPALADTRVEKRWDAATQQRVSIAVEQWTYNFGSNQFVSYVTVVDGKVTRIERGSYGYPEEKIGPQPSGRARCDSSALHVGERKLDLLAKCGEPALREAKEEKRGDEDQWKTVQIETWTYDFGPQAFVHVVTFENGKVTQVERGGYGYAR